MSGSASGYQGEAAVIREWFEAGWESGVPLQLVENAPFPDKPTNAPWARLAVRSTDARVASVGGPSVRFRHAGDIILEVFVPEGVGDGRARELADLGCDIVRAREESGIRVWAPRAIPLGVRDGWYRINVVAPYERDETFTIH